MLKKIGIALLLLVSLLVGLIAYHWQIHAQVSANEAIPVNESDEIAIAAEKAKEIVKGLQTSYAARGVHAKGHACVKALVTVPETISTALQHGVFAQVGKQYKAWIRFSNSGSDMAKADDHARDARGMAIKLLHAGLNLNHGDTQDFIAHNSPAFFVTSVADYNAFVATKGDPAYFIQGWNPLKWRLRELWQLVTAYAPPPASPLWTEYFSNTAYKLGPQRVKFKMRACDGLNQTAIPKEGDPDFLKHNLKQELANDPACMQMMMQRQDLSKTMPIEDATVLWKESAVPFETVAKIEILKQTFDTPEQQQFCEDLSFNPWNALSQHQPLGALNRARRAVYDASASIRHRLNGRTVPSQLDW